MSLWKINRGFLPSSDPILSLSQSYEFNRQIVVLENLSHNLSNYLEARKVREELVFDLRELGDILPYLRSLKESDLERAMLLYSSFASAYVNSFYEHTADRIPIEISIPLNFIANKLGRKPILSYSSLVLFNWTEGGYEPLQLFCSSDFEEEIKFISFHINMEFVFSKFISNIFTDKSNTTKLVFLLDSIRALQEMFFINENMLNVITRNFDNINYEDIGIQSHVGFNIYQSPSIWLIHKGFGLPIPDDKKMMLDYMVRQHRKVIDAFKEKCFTYFTDLDDFYDSCLREFICFMNKYNSCVGNQKYLLNPEDYLNGGTSSSV